MTWPGAQKVAAHLAAAWSPAATARALLPRRGAGGAHRFAALDGARALALIWVLAYHSVGLSNMRGLTEADPETQPAAADVAALGQRWANSWQTQLWQNGNMGVDIFFTLSGFLICHFWLQEVEGAGRFRYWRFLARRFLRLWPALFLAIWFSALVNWLYAGQAGLDECLSDWWSIALFVNNHVHVGGCLSHTWTVATEAQFYVLSPLLLWLVYSPAARRPRRFGLPALAAASLAGVAVNLGLMLGDGTSAFTMPLDWPPTFSFTSVVTRSPPYIAGMFAAVLLHRAARLPTAAAAPDDCPGGAAGGVDAAAPTPKAQPLAGAGLGRAARLAHRLPLRADLPALLLTCGLAYTGTGMNMWIQQQAPALNKVLQVAGDWAYGWGLAGVYLAVLQGRLRPLGGLLTARALAPVAALSYSAYLVQDWPMLAFPSWLDAQVVTMWAGWATMLLSLGLIVGFALLIALPFFFLVERPFAQLWPRTW